MDLNATRISCTAPEIAKEISNQNAANSTPSHSKKSPPQKAELVNKAKYLKAKKKQLDPKDWKDFVTPMASGEELEIINMRKSKKKFVRRGADHQQEPDPPSSMVGGWEFGKKLGLSSKDSDAVMDKLIRGEESVPKKLEAGRATFK